MSEQTYTPGPWHPTGPWTKREAGHGLQQWDVERTRPEAGGWTTVAEVGCWRDEAEADARLIAAAPELLEAARGFLWALSVVDGTTGPDLRGEKLDALRAAVAKATGDELPERAS